MASYGGPILMYKGLIVGLGNIGYGYDSDQVNPSIILSHFRAISFSTNFELVGVIDSDSKKLREIMKVSGLKGYSGLAELGNSKNVDLIVIATPPKSHLEDLKQAIGLKPQVILLEKPVSSDSEDLEEIIHLINNSEVKTFVNYQRNYQSIFRNIAKQIGSGEIAGPFNFSCWFNKGWINNGSHWITLFKLLFAVDLDQVSFINFENKVLGIKAENVIAQFIEIDNANGAFGAFELIGKDKSIRYDSHLGTLKISKMGQDKYYAYDSMQEPHIVEELRQFQDLNKVYSEIFNYLSGKRHYSVTVDEGASVLRLLAKANLED